MLYISACKDKKKHLINELSHDTGFLIANQNKQKQTGVRQASIKTAYFARYKFASFIAFSSKINYLCASCAAECTPWV